MQERPLQRLQPASNGLAEIGCREVKALLMKCKDNKECFETAFAEYRIAPMEDGYRRTRLRSRPASHSAWDREFGFKTRTQDPQRNVPAEPAIHQSCLLKDQAGDGVPTKSKQAKVKREFRFNFPVRKGKLAR